MLDDALVQALFVYAVYKSKVSILVMLDDALVLMKSLNVNLRVQNVSILVMLDDALVRVLVYSHQV